MKGDGILLNQLYNIIFNQLVSNCPVLSGNMKSRISSRVSGDLEYEIVIDAPTYDMDKWLKEKRIVLDGKGNYALEVERFGGFHRYNSSTHWVRDTLEGTTLGFCNAHNCVWDWNLRFI